MGSWISSLVFLPPSRRLANLDSDIKLQTKHLSHIVLKYIDRSARLTLIISHGNAEDVTSTYDWAYGYLLPFVNVNVACYEYTGYGHNEGNHECSESNTYNDIEAVYEYLTKQLKIEPSNIVVYGRSLGSGPSCYLAEKYPIKGVIINSGFLSIYRVVFYFRFTMPGDLYPNINRVRNIKCPILIFHSIKDEVVPFYHALELYENAYNPYDPLFIDGTSHNNIDKVCEEVFNHINRFLKHLDSNYSTPSDSFVNHMSYI